MVFLGLQAFFQGDEELAGFGEGLDELHVAVEGFLMAELFFDTVEGVPTFACEVVDVFEQGNVVGSILSCAFGILMGMHIGYFRLPETQHGGVNIQHLGHFSD